MPYVIAVVVFFVGIIFGTIFPAWILGTIVLVALLLSCLFLYIGRNSGMAIFVPIAFLVLTITGAVGMGISYVLQHTNVTMSFS